MKILLIQQTRHIVFLSKEKQSRTLDTLEKLDLGALETIDRKIKVLFDLRRKQVQTMIQVVGPSDHLPALAWTRRSLETRLKATKRAAKGVALA